MSRVTPRLAAIAAATALVLTVAGGAWALTTSIGSDPATPQLVQADGVPRQADGREALLRWAERTLAGECMVERDFSFWVLWRPEEGQQSVEPHHSGYAVSDPLAAEREGFRIGQALFSPPPAVENPNRDYAESLPPEQRDEYSRAFHGGTSDRVEVTLPSGLKASVSENGCLSLARTELYGDLAEWLRLDTTWKNFDAEIAELVRAEPDYLTAMEAWSGCIADLGWDASEPADLRSHVTEAYRSEARDVAWQVERGAAVAEAKCATNTGFVDVADRLHDHIREELEKERAVDRQSFDAILDGARQRAESLLGGYSDDHGS